MGAVRRRGVRRLLPGLGRRSRAEVQPGGTSAPAAAASVPGEPPAPEQALGPAADPTGWTAGLEDVDADWGPVDHLPCDMPEAGPLPGRSEADLRAYVLALEQRRRAFLEQEAADRARSGCAEDDVDGWFVGNDDPAPGDWASQPAAALEPRAAQLPGAAAHPLDEPGFDLEGLLGWSRDTGSRGWPCRRREGGYEHFVAARSGWHGIGYVDVDLDCAPGAADLAPPGLFTVWARCKDCFWPVFSMGFYTDPKAQRCAFYTELGVTGDDDDGPGGTAWRLLTPARARAVGAEWPVPWHFFTPHESTGVPW